MVLTLAKAVNVRNTDAGVKISYFIHGRGHGHASRALSIVPALRRAGHLVSVYTGGDGTDLIATLGDFEHVDPILPGAVGLSRLPLRLSRDHRRIRRERPALVISDGDMPSLTVAKAFRIRTLAIGHDLVFSRCELPADLPRRHMRTQRRSGFFAHHLSDFGIPVHFLPIEPSARNTRVARPALRPELAGEVDNSGPVLCYFRDRNGRPAVDLAAAAGAQVVCFGDPDLSGPGIDARPFDREAFAEMFRTCSAVIGSAGSNLLAECVMLKKPVLALHRKSDSEQLMNGILAEAAQVAQTATFEGLSSADVTRFLDRVKAEDFAQVDLVGALPDAATAVLEAITI
jgi:uncharacterized protein (TIGR00661 family)